MRMSRGLVRVAFVMGLVVACAGVAKADPIQQITLGDYYAADVLDFESASLGPISGTDTMFTSFGISSVSASGGNFIDPYDVRTNSSRALWFQSSGLVIVDPGAAGNGLASYEIEFSSVQARFGVGAHDYFPGADLNFAFFAGAVAVGDISVTNPTADLSMFYFDVTGGFDRVIVTAESTNAFAIDNITLDRGTAPVPEPASLTLMGLGLGGIAWTRKRRRRL